MEKRVVLRAFKIENNDLVKADSGMMGILSRKLNGSKARDRRMKINPEDEEEDLLSDFNVYADRMVNGLMLRICQNDDVPSLPENLLDNEKITTTELLSTDANNHVCKDQYYFALNNKFVVVALFKNNTIARLQTYINWFLEGLRGDTLFEITPLLKTPDQTEPKDLKSITFKDSSIDLSPKQEKIASEEGRGERFKINSEQLEKLFVDSEKYRDLKQKKIVSASLLIKFSKPRKMALEEYNSFLGAALKSLNDVDSLIIQTKHGRFKGGLLLRTKDVLIELTEKGKLSEHQLLQEMEKYLDELKNENTL